MTAPTDETPQCPSPGHVGAVLAVTTITHPGEDTEPTLACSGCARTAIDTALAQGHAIRLDPVPSSYGICPRCGKSARLRPASGTIGAHRVRWVNCVGVGAMPARPGDAAP